jgi:hypothetical protein
LINAAKFAKGSFRLVSSQFMSVAQHLAVLAEQREDGGFVVLQGVRVSGIMPLCI